MFAVAEFALNCLLSLWKHLITSYIVPIIWLQFKKPYRKRHTNKNFVDNKMYAMNSLVTERSDSIVIGNQLESINQGRRKFNTFKSIETFTLYCCLMLLKHLEEKIIHFDFFIQKFHELNWSKSCNSICAANIFLSSNRMPNHYINTVIQNRIDTKGLALHTCSKNEQWTLAKHEWPTECFAL